MRGSCQSHGGRLGFVVHRPHSSPPCTPITQRAALPLLFRRSLRSILPPRRRPTTKCARRASLSCQVSIAGCSAPASFWFACSKDHGHGHACGAAKPCQHQPLGSPSRGFASTQQPPQPPPDSPPPSLHCLPPLQAGRAPPSWFPGKRWPASRCPARCSMPASGAPGASSCKPCLTSAARRQPEWRGMGPADRACMRPCPPQRPIAGTGAAAALSRPPSTQPCRRSAAEAAAALLSARLKGPRRGRPWFLCKCWPTLMAAQQGASVEIRLPVTFHFDLRSQALQALPAFNPSRRSFFPVKQPTHGRRAGRPRQLPRRPHTCFHTHTPHAPVQIFVSLHSLRLPVDPIKVGTTTQATLPHGLFRPQ